MKVLLSIVISYFFLSFIRMIELLSCLDLSVCTYETALKIDYGCAP